MTVVTISDVKLLTDMSSYQKSACIRTVTSRCISNNCRLGRMVVEYLEMKLRGDNLNFKILGKFQRRWDLGNDDLVRLGDYHWWPFAK